MHISATPPFRQAGAPALVLSAALSTPAGIARAIALLAQTNEAFRIPLFTAVAHDQIALCHVWPDQAPPLSKLDRTGRPALLVASDDDDITRVGPAGWPHADRILRWARGIILHGSGGQREHYLLAVEGAVQARRFAVIETSSAQLDAWSEAALRFLPAARILRIQPFHGGLHPIPSPPETVQ